MALQKFYDETIFLANIHILIIENLYRNPVVRNCVFQVLASEVPLLAK